MRERKREKERERLEEVKQDLFVYLITSLSSHMYQKGYVYQLPSSHLIRIKKKLILLHEGVPNPCISMLSNVTLLGSLILSMIEHTLINWLNEGYP